MLAPQAKNFFEVIAYIIKKWTKNSIYIFQGLRPPPLNNSGSEDAQMKIFDHFLVEGGGSYTFITGNEITKGEGEFIFFIYQL